jgi:hypothetical protein
MTIPESQFVHVALVLPSAADAKAPHALFLFGFRGYFCCGVVTHPND